MLDGAGHHSRMCCAGGDRTIRHNRLRNAVYTFAKYSAAARPELEKASLLLPPRPSDNHNNRRPADVFLPTWSDGLPAALDFAITAPQRQGVVSESAAGALHAAKAYSDHKRSYQNTAQLCEAQGIVFRPMVCETSGAWAPEATALLKQLATAAAGRLGQPTGTLYRELLQRTSVAVRLANARAHLKRSTAT